MKKIQPNSNIASKFLNGIVTKVNAIIDKLIVDVKVNGESVVTVNEDGEREADIDLSLADQNVKQSPTTDNKDYRVLLSKSDNDTEETDIARKNTNLKYNPSTGNLQATKLNGNTIPSGSGTDTLAKTSDIPDMSDYIQKSLTVGLVKNDGTIDQTQYATMSDIPDELADLADDENHRLVTDAEKSAWDAKADISDITSAIEDLDVTGASNIDAGKTIKAWSETDGKVSITTQNISITKSQIRDFPTIPTVNDGKLTINQNGTLKGEFTANDSDDVTVNLTDENVKQTDITDTSWRCLTMASDATKTETTAGVRKTVGLTMQVNKVGTASQTGQIVLAIGNSIATGNADNYRGYLDIYNNGKRSRIYSNTTDNRNMVIPNKAGTFALTSDIPTKTSDLTNDSNFVSDANYVHTDVNFTSEYETKLSGIEPNAQVNTVTGVKGSSETDYRTGNISISKSDVGLGSVPNVTTNNQKPTFTQASTRTNLVSNTDTLSTIMGKIMKWFDDLKDLAFITKDGSTSTYLRGDGQWTTFPTIPTVNNAKLIIQKNGTNVKTFTANASSDVTANIVVPTALSDLTDDATHRVVTDTQISSWDSKGTSNLTLGTSSTTAYRGDRGNTAYTHATDSGRLTTATTVGLYKVGSTAQGHISTLTAVEKADITALGIPASDTNTHRPIQLNGTQILGNNTTVLNLKDGTNVSMTNSSGTVTINATDTDKRKGFYGTTDTAAATATKVVTLSNTDGWELKAGVIVGVYFSETNTAGSVKLNVNGSGAKSISYTGNTAYTGTNANISGRASHTTYYMYNGTYWVFFNCTYNYQNSTYTINNKTISLQLNGTAVDSFTLNQSTDKTINFPALPLAGGRMTAPILDNHNMGSVDYTQSNNGLSSGTKYMGMIEGQDKNNARISRLETVVKSTGEIGIALSVSNYVSSASTNKTVLAAYVDKSGTTTYSVQDAKNFRSAIGASWQSWGSFNGGDGAQTLMADNLEEICFKFIPTYPSYNVLSSVMTIPIIAITATSDAQAAEFITGFSGSTLADFPADQFIVIRVWHNSNKVKCKLVHYNLNGGDYNLNYVNVYVYYK